MAGAARPRSRPAIRPRYASGSPIKHVVFIIQENRSFNNLFMGYPKATTQSYGYDSNGNKIALKPRRASRGVGYRALPHRHFSPPATGRDSLPGTDCKMDGWNRARLRGEHSRELRLRVRPAKSKSSRTGRWRSSTCSPTKCSRRTSTEVSSRISTPSRPSPSRGRRSERSRGDAKAERAIPSRRCDKRERTGRVDRRLLRQPDDRERGRRGRSELALLHRRRLRRRRAVVGLSSRPQDLQRSGLERRRHQSAGAVSRATLPAGSSRTSPGSRRLDASSDHPGLNAANGPAWVASVVNAIGESKFWRFDGDLHHVGRLGRLVRPGPAGLRRLRRPRISRAVDRRLAVRAARAT